MPKTKYHLSFSENDIEKLNSVLSESNPDSKLHLRAKVLLALEQSTRISATTLAIAKECGTSDTTVQSVRTKFALYGLDNALYKECAVLFTDLLDFIYFSWETV